MIASIGRGGPRGEACGVHSVRVLYSFPHKIGRGQDL